MSDPGSSILQEKLKTAMQQELFLTRELLGNLHQEEQSLIVQDSHSWNQVMEQRSHMLEKLKDIRSSRVETAGEIAKVLHVTSLHFLEESFPLDLESCCEILHLSDQLIALTERMNSQQNRNHYLMTHTSRFIPFLPPSPKKVKVSVATYPEDPLD